MSLSIEHILLYRHSRRSVIYINHISINENVHVHINTFRKILPCFSFSAREQFIHSALRINISSKKTLLQKYKLSHEIWIRRMCSLTLISYCFSLVHVWKKHVRSSSRRKYPQPPLLCSFF